MKKKKKTLIDTTSRGSRLGASVAFGGVNNFDAKETASKVFTHPIDLAYYARKLADCIYLPGIEQDDIVAAIILRSAYRRRQWPTTAWQKLWLEQKDKYLAAKLDDVASRDAWLDIQQAKYIDPETGEPFQKSSDDENCIDESGLVAAPKTGADRGPGPGALAVYAIPEVVGLPRNYLAENVAMTVRTLPRLRSLGLMYLEELEAAATPKPDLNDDNSGGGGRKTKMKMSSPSVEDSENEPLVLTAEEMAELGIQFAK